MPFRKSLRIVLAVPPGEPPRAYYHINYETFAARDVQVVSFPPVFSDQQQAKIRAIAGAWENMREETKKVLSDIPFRHDITLAPGEEKSWFQQDAPGVLKTWWLEIKADESLSALARAKLLRQLSLSMYWDGNSTASVNVPLGDFFFNAFRAREFESLPVAYLEGKYLCRFPMPFQKSALCKLKNEAPYPVSIRCGYTAEPLAVNTAPLNYFHAAWNQTSRDGFSFLTASAKGKGYLAGCYLISIGADGSWNMLEGDESIYRDGEAIPSMHGTGLEDYFNAGWYYARGLFTRPLHGLIEKAAMRTAQYRVFLTDKIDFNEGFRFNFEFGDGNRSQGYMSGITYWYMSTPSSSGTIFGPVEKRFPAQDRFEAGATMCGLFELERIGHLEEAMQWCGEMAERYSGTQAGPFYRLRALAYQETLKGYDSVSNAYYQFAEKYKGTPYSEEAEKLIWFQQADTNALLSMQMNGRYNFYLDGKLLSAADSSDYLAVLKVPLSSGKHEIALDFTSTRPEEPKMLIYLRTHRGDFEITGSTDPKDEHAPSGWMCSKERPANWPDPNDPNVTWLDSVATGFHLPHMSQWLFIPNAFINVQSSGYITRLWENWHTSRQTAYMKLTIDLP